MFYQSEMRKRMSSNDGASAESSLGTEELSTISEAERLERKSLVVWRRPLMTLKYGILETSLLLIKLGLRLLDRRLLAGLLILVIIYCVPGPHERYKMMWRQNLGFAIYWLGLGVLSSVGFGTGLHTFLLYLGPHIASVTLAAYECQTLDFPMPPYPEQKICPKEPYDRHVPTMWQILAKVRIESLLWGVGTALGELPPYFMAKTARLSGKCVEERQDMAELQRRSGISLFERSKLLVERAVLGIGFFGILLCASVPNPLFDLAGVACGHFLVPFWKFFVATLIGKAVIKATIQQLIVVVAFSEDLVKVLIQSLSRIPYLGSRMQLPIQNMLATTKLRMHQKTKDDSDTGLDLVASVFQFFALILVAFCVVSLLNALAQKHFHRLQDQKREKQHAQETKMEIQPTKESEQTQEICG